LPDGPAASSPAIGDIQVSIPRIPEDGLRKLDDGQS
jgi:hypothetical protein